MSATSPPKKMPIHLQSSQQRLLIKNGRIVNDDQIFDADIYIENGIIAQIGPKLTVPGGVKVIDAKAGAPNEVNYVLPGGVDSHTHFQANFMGATTADDYYSGTRAAIAGGTTTILNFAMTSKQAPSMVEAVDRERALADSQVNCDYCLHAVISDWKDGITDTEIRKLVEKGINSFKIFLCYENLKLRDDQVIKVLQACSKYGAIVIVHCENGDIIEYNANKLIAAGITGPEGHLYSRPESVEAEATHRISVLAEQVGCPVLVAHCMSKSASKVISDERSKNSALFGETLVAAIGTDGTHYFHECWQHAASHILSPPLRPDPSTPSYLLNALAAGNLQILGSDHCVFNTQQKAVGERDFRMIPNGVNGVEERMLLGWEKGVRGGYLDPCKFVAITSTNAAKLFNLYPKKGRIQVGSDADLVIWGRNVQVIKAERHNSKCDTNIFEGTRVESGPIVVVCQGKVVLDQAGLHVVQGNGRFIARQPFPLTAYGPLKIKNRILPPRINRQAGDDKKASGNGQIESEFAGLNISGSVDVEGYHARATKSGVKNMQDSTFKLTGEQIDDKNNRSNIRVSGQPPGGRSSGLW